SDGKKMLIRHFPLIDKLIASANNIDLSLGSISREDVRHDAYEAFFRKMYGNSPREVEKKLVKIYWMKNLYGKKYPLKVTTVNGVDKRLQRISAALEKLPPSFHKYVKKPASGYYWRNVAKESYLSMHSFGIAIDINLDYSNYWLWDYLSSKKKLTHLTLRNKIPMEIVDIFEKEGFVWGGRWYHYDTMHFEYKPEVYL
ncbi:M15 family metallopeptidase, partial [Gammaproteobacteria bacterium]|nr:M15 family metallopeptidase [Gammaproteobacteria bacterium]